MNLEAWAQRNSDMLGQIFHTKTAVPTDPVKGPMATDVEDQEAFLAHARIQPVDPLKPRTEIQDENKTHKH